MLSLEKMQFMFDVRLLFSKYFLCRITCNCVCLSVSVHGFGFLHFIQADVYVNTAHNQLNLNHGAVAQSLLKAGGSTIQDECNRVVASRGTIAYWDIATTTGGYLQCQHIIHTVGANYQGRGCEQVCTIFCLVQDNAIM